MMLSIGDGANHVTMIQEANMGCGLLGLEGSQVAISADYAFGQFRFLTKLLRGGHINVPPICIAISAPRFADYLFSGMQLVADIGTNRT
jgi:hypothetical protein